jgi:hypothetical protein
VRKKVKLELTGRKQHETNGKQKLYQSPQAQNEMKLELTGTDQNYITAHGTE